MTPPAAFIVETIQAEGGVNIARAAWLAGAAGPGARARQPVHPRRHPGRLRTHRVVSSASTSWASTPTSSCLAKGIGGYGTPLALLLIKPERDKWAPGEHTGTFRGQGLSFVAGAEALGYFATTS